MDLDWKTGTDLRDDPLFISIGNRFKSIQNARIEELKQRYNILGINSLGGDIRPKLLFCNMRSDNMFDHKTPEVGDVIALGYVYGDDAASVLICKLSKHHTQRQDMRICPETNYFFSWDVEPITTHRFDAVKR
jgi:hypothetical protein